MSAGELGQVADQRGQLVHLGAYVVQQLLPVLGAQAAALVRLGEQVEVGPDARQRRPQLVPGVADQPPLPVL